MSESILEFDGVEPAEKTGALTARFEAGVLVLIQLDTATAAAPLADLAQGLAVPQRGRVLFLGEPWSDRQPARSLARRGMIGRVFEEHGWISNLNVLENVTLAQRHHSRRPVAELVAEAETLARRFGLERVPLGRPARTAPQALRRSQWIRAFLGQPRLVLLEEPLRVAGANAGSLLLEEIRATCARQASVIWLTTGRVTPPTGLTTVEYSLRGYTLEARSQPGTSTSRQAPA